jgi:hypothetical protein
MASASSFSSASSGVEKRTVMFRAPLDTEHELERGAVDERVRQVFERPMTSSRR